MFNVNFTLSELVRIKSELNFLSGLLINQTTYADRSLDDLMKIVDEKIETILDRANEVNKEDF